MRSNLTEAVEFSFKNGGRERKERERETGTKTTKNKKRASNSGTINSPAAPGQNTKCADKNIGELMAAAAERTIENKGWATDICYFLMIKHNSQISNVW